MRVLMLLANAFTNDPRVYAEAKSLIGAGHSVTVIAWDRERSNPRRQVWDGIDVVRIRARLALRYGFASWLINGLNLLMWWQEAYRRALTLNKERRFDVVHCHDLDTLAIGARLKRKLGLQLVYDAHEIYGHMMANSLPTWIVKMIFWLEKRLVAKADRIINVCEPQQRYFETITDRPITIVMNCKPLQSLEYQPSLNQEFTILYVGSLHQARAVPMLVQTACDLPGVLCLIGGIGRPDYVQSLEQECSKTSNVSFLGRVPFHEVIPMTEKADCVFLMVSPQALNDGIGLGNKQFEAMVCGRPIICTKGTYSGDLTEQEEVGLTVEYNEQALRDAIIKLRDDPALRERLGRNALKAAIREYNWEKQEEELLKLYGSLRVNGE